jgi:hypothetical protein
MPVMWDSALIRIHFNVIETSTHTGLRDIALLGVLAYTFARIGAVVNLKVENYYPSGLADNTPRRPACKGSGSTARGLSGWPKGDSGLAHHGCRFDTCNTPVHIGEWLSNPIEM